MPIIRRLDGLAMSFPEYLSHPRTSARLHYLWHPVSGAWPGKGYRPSENSEAGLLIEKARGVLQS